MAKTSRSLCMNATPLWYCKIGLREDINGALALLKISLHDDESEWDFVVWSQSPLSLLQKDVSDVTVVKSLVYLQNLIRITSIVLFGMDQQKHVYRMCMCRKLFCYVYLLFEKLIFLHAANAGGMSSKV